MSSKQKKGSKKKKGGANAKNPALPAGVEKIRSRVVLKNQNLENTAVIEDPDAFKEFGYDNSLSLDSFKENFEIRITSLTEEEMTFDMVGIDAPLANAFRRILIAEVPTMAIEKVKLFQNTSILQDEILAHRLGLIPIQADPREFKFVSESKDFTNNEENTTVFTLQAACTRNSDVPDSAPNEQKFNNSTVLAKDLVWVPQGRQAKKFAQHPIGVVNGNIVVAKLRPGQSIEAELWVEKGLGQTHAKWSPVSTATYRLLPEIEITKPIEGARAEKLVQTCPMDVFDIEDLGKGRKRAVVANVRNCTMCRECIRDGELDEGELRKGDKEANAKANKFADSIELRRVRDHFLFSIESVGMYSPQDLLREAVRVLKQKCANAKRLLHEEESVRP
jgi:DNA-directed RNA polymerase I and III subunit RPAC1